MHWIIVTTGNYKTVKISCDRQTNKKTNQNEQQVSNDVVVSLFSDEPYGEAIHTKKNSHDFIYYSCVALSRAFTHSNQFRDQGPMPKPNDCWLDGER